MLDLALAHLDLVKRIVHERAPGVRIWAFGSRVTGHAKPFSDLDLALEGTDELDPGMLFALRDDLSESDLPIMVDIARPGIASRLAQALVAHPASLILAGVDETMIAESYDRPVVVAGC